MIPGKGSARTLLVLAASVAGLTHGSAIAQDSAPADPAPCMSSGPARQLDFWLGTWDVYSPEDGRRLGVNVVERELGGCLVMENWTGARGSSGRSMNFWDPQRRTWRQVWVSDRGNVLDYRHGEFRDRAMRFEGITIGEEGDTTHQRLTFHDVAPDTVRQVFEASGDGGATWRTTWVGIYVRRGAPEDSPGGGSGTGASGGPSPDTGPGAAIPPSFLPWLNDAGSRQAPPGPRPWGTHAPSG